MKTQLDLARELRTQLEQYFTIQYHRRRPGETWPNPEVKWLCEPEEIDKMILAAFDKSRKIK